MIEYKIVRVDVDMQSMQVRYRLEGYPDFFTRVAFPAPYTEDSLHEIAKKQALQAQRYWDSYFKNPPIQLENDTGYTKPTYVAEPTDYDPGQHKLVEEVLVEEDKIVVNYVTKPLSSYEKADAIRNKRDALLAQTDAFALVDRPMTEEMLAYREALRNITEQEGFPHEVVWPILPLN
jgi:hypothetical protein